MKSKTRIPAYTISEMIVVLILTSIVVGMAFSILNLVQKHMYGIQDNFNKHSELNKLEQSLWLDFNRYSTIDYDSIEDTLKFTTELDSITYKFTTPYIVKNLDTFHIQLHSKTFYFDGVSRQNGKIDAVKIATSTEFQNQELFVFRSNDATLYMD